MGKDGGSEGDGRNIHTWSIVPQPHNITPAQPFTDFVLLANQRLVFLHLFHAGVESREPVVIDVGCSPPFPDGRFFPSGGSAKAGKFGEAI